MDGHCTAFGSPVDDVPSLQAACGVPVECPEYGIQQGALAYAIGPRRGLSRFLPVMPYSPGSVGNLKLCLPAKDLKSSISTFSMSNTVPVHPLDRHFEIAIAQLPHCH